MSNELALTFEGAPWRIIIRNGDPWIVLADVCAVLEIGNASDVARRLDDDEKGIDTIDTLRGPQQLLIISEAGLYKVLQSSNKRIAKRLDRWNRHEVLPEIRRTGSYRGSMPDIGLRVDALERRADQHDARLDQHERTLVETHQYARETHGNVIKVVQWQEKARLPKPRRFSEEDERICYLVVHLEFGGKCPIDRVTRLTDDKGRRLKDISDMDHWHGPQYNSIENALPVSLAVHKKLTSDPDYRAANAPTFQHFHLVREKLKEQGVFVKPKSPRKSRKKILPDKNQLNFLD